MGEKGVSEHEATERMKSLLPKLGDLCASLRLVHGLVEEED